MQQQCFPDTLAIWHYEYVWKNTSWELQNIAASKFTHFHNHYLRRIFTSAANENGLHSLSKFAFGAEVCNVGVNPPFSICGKRELILEAATSFSPKIYMFAFPGKSISGLIGREGERALCMRSCIWGWLCQVTAGPPSIWSLLSGLEISEAACGPPSEWEPPTPRWAPCNQSDWPTRQLNYTHTHTHACALPHDTPLSVSRLSLCRP